MNFLIMQNVARVRNTEDRLYQFDLKGSTIDRYVIQDTNEELRILGMYEDDLNIISRKNMITEELDFSLMKHNRKTQNKD